MAQLQELFGAKLVQKGGVEVDTAEALAGAKAIGIYFSAHWCPPCRGFTPKLAEWYTKDLQAKGMQIVFVSSDRDEKSFQDYFAEMPWLALPYSNRDGKDKLSKLYKVQGIPSFVILNPEGEIITKSGRAKVTADPTGEDFPWVPPTIDELLDTPIHGSAGDSVPAKDALAGKKVGIYFSAHWCPPCRGFTPVLSEVYKALKAEDKNFEIVFASSDRDEAAFKEYHGEMPWMALPYSDRKRKENMSEFFGVEGIPMLVILDENRDIVNKNATGIVRSLHTDGGAEAAAKGFPWAPELVREVNQDCDEIDERPSFIVLQEKATPEQQKAQKDAVTVVAERLAKEAKEKKDDPEFNIFLASKEGQISQRVRDECSAPIAEGTQVVMMDIPDKGAYYTFSGEVTTETVEQFLKDYKEKKLTRKQMGA